MTHRGVRGTGGSEGAAVWKTVRHIISIISLPFRKEIPHLASFFQIITSTASDARFQYARFQHAIFQPALFHYTLFQYARFQSLPFQHTHFQHTCPTSVKRLCRPKILP